MIYPEYALGDFVTEKQNASRYHVAINKREPIPRKVKIMLEHFVELFLEVLIPLCELMGISIVAISACASFWQYAKSLVKRIPCNVKFQLANGLALSLEFKMAAEILKTVLIRDFGELLVLGAVIILRALLSFLIHFEMNHSKENHEDVSVKNC